MKNFWLETIKSIYHQWEGREPELMAANAEKLVVTMGPGPSKYEWKQHGLSLKWEFHAVDDLITYCWNGGDPQEWNWEEAPNILWGDDGSFRTSLEEDGDALVFGNHFRIFMEEEYKNG